MRTRWKRCLIGLVLIACLLTGSAVALASGAGADKTSALTDFIAKVTQNGVEITDGGSLTSTDPINIEISFGVPVAGDDPTPSVPVYQYDTATFRLSDAFTLVSGESIALKMGDITVGHVHFATDPATRMVVAEVLFDGDTGVFDGTYNTVSCRFSADFEYDDNGDAGGTGEHIVTILEKTYTVVVPAPDILYNLTKTGQVNMADKSIEWTVQVSATQGGENISLEGYQFSDDLSTTGEYVAGSFQVDDAAAEPTYESSRLGYLFPSGSESPKKVTFKTALADANYYAASQQSVGNKAELLDRENGLVTDAQYTVRFTPRWIEKKGAASDSGSSGVYDPQNRTITWTITANQYNADLKNAVITDVLPEGLTLQSAQWQRWEGSGWGAANSISPNADGEYYLGNINSQILLTLVTSVPDEAYATGVYTYRNSAQIRWDGLTGELSTGGVNVGIGYNAISKTGEADPATRSVLWTVHVNAREQSIPDMKVYDLLVYGSGGFDAGTASGFPAGLTPTELTPRYDQQYIDGSFAGAGLSVWVYPISQNGLRVADLLEITGLATDADNVFTFRSLVLNPNIFAGNKTSTLYNTASLFSGNTKLNQATGSAGYTNHSLTKQMLNRSAAGDPAAGVNSAATSDAAAGFDYIDKSVIFRLNVNADGMDITGLTNAAGQALGAATVTDTLPEGWEFVDITEGMKYLVFEGDTSTNGTVTATDTSPDVVPGMSASLNGRTATFTFQTLNRPYVILVKARPTNDTLAGYFGANQTTTVRNTLALHTENWTPGVSSYQDAKVASNLLTKTINVPQAGELRWTIDYRPYQLTQLGTMLQDTLPVGIDLRTDATGALLIDGYISAYEMTLAADGSYSLGAEVPLTVGSNISYDSATRLLSFLIPDNTRGYRFSYLTVVTGDPGTISNHVALYGGSTEQETTSEPYVITSADGEASLRLNGWISILKTDESGSPLAGAEFTLYAQDGVSVVRKGFTAADGSLKFKVLPDGNYLLLETAAPSGYALENIRHTVSVSTTNGVVTTSVDGKTGVNSNALTVKDFPQNTVGSLTLTKTVNGTAGDKTKKFNFTVLLNGASGTYQYIGQGVPDGSLRSGDTVSLAHRQSITIIGLPVGTVYAISEQDDGSGYTVYAFGETGTIIADTRMTAAYTNIKNLPAAPGVGNLTIRKTVQGDLGDLKQSFTFTITLDADGRFAYRGSQSGSLQSGDTITLTSGQSVTIEALPIGTVYRITENEANQYGYITSATGNAGVIKADDQTADFVNARFSPPKTGDDSNIALWLLTAFMAALLAALSHRYRRAGRKAR